MNPIQAARVAQDHDNPTETADTVVNNDDPIKGYTLVFDNVILCAALSDSAFRTYAILKTHDHGNGVFPGMHRLACLQGVSRRTIQANMDEIKKLGLVIPRRRGLGRTNEYDIVDARACQLPAPRPITDRKTDVQQVAHQLLMGNILHIKKGNGLHIHGEPDCTSNVKPVSHQAVQPFKHTAMEAAEDGMHASPPPTADVNNDDLPEWGTSVVAPWTIEVQTPAPMPLPIAATPPVAVVAQKPTRKSTLQQSEPEVYACREAIKARYFERYTAETWDTMPRSKQTYANDDAERIARVCADLDEAYSLMQAVWDERWSNGTYPNRAPFKLSRCPEKLKAHRDGLLTAVAATRPSNVGRPADSQVGTGRKDGLRYNPVPQYYSCAQGVGNRLGCGFAEGFPHETVTCGRTGMVTPGEDATRAAS